LERGGTGSVDGGGLGRLQAFRRARCWLDESRAQAGHL